MHLESPLLTTQVIRSFAIPCHLSKTVLSHSIDVISLIEPSVRDLAITDRLDRYSEVIFSDGLIRAALYVSAQLAHWSVRTRHVVVILCISPDEILIVSFYCSPSENILHVLDQLADLVGGIPCDKIVFVRNFCVKSSISENRPTDPRSEEVVFFALYNYFKIINSPDSAPTFDIYQGWSWVNLFAWFVNVHIALLTWLFKTRWRLLIIMPWLGPIKRDQVIVYRGTSAIGWDIGTWSGCIFSRICRLQIWQLTIGTLLTENWTSWINLINLLGPSQARPIAGWYTCLCTPELDSQSSRVRAPRKF